MTFHSRRFGLIAVGAIAAVGLGGCVTVPTGPAAMSTGVTTSRCSTSTGGTTSGPLRAWHA